MNDELTNTKAGSGVLRISASAYHIVLRISAFQACERSQTREAETLLSSMLAVIFQTLAKQG